MYKLTTECAFQFNQNLFKQTEGCSMGGPLSVTLADIHMIRTEKDIVTPLKPVFYKIFVDEIYTRRQKGIHDKLYERLNNYHPNIKLAIEINPNKFLDTEVIENEGAIEARVYSKTIKLPVSQVSNIPKRYNRNTINRDLYRAKRIATNLGNELVIIKRKFLAADYPHRFINSIINTFIEKENRKEEEYLIPQKSFRNSKTSNFN